MQWTPLVGVSQPESHFRADKQSENRLGVWAYGCPSFLNSPSRLRAWGKHDELTLTLPGALKSASFGRLMMARPVQ
jgi:hypothetical protein